MKTKFLFLSLVAIFGLSSCVSNNSEDNESATSQDEESAIAQSSFEEMLSVADSFSEQDYKTLTYELLFSYDIESDDSDELEITSGNVTTYTKYVYDASTSGDFYFYSYYSMVISDGTTEYLSNISEYEVLSIDNVYKEVDVIAYTYNSSNDYSGDFEENLKSGMDVVAAYYMISKDTVIEVNSILSNPSYSSSDNAYTIKGDTIVGNVATLTTLFSSLEYNNSLGSQKLDENYENASVDYEFSFNQYGYLLKEEINVLDSVGFVVTVNSSTETVSYELDITNLIYSTNLSYDEEIERANLYQTYVLDAE